METMKNICVYMSCSSIFFCRVILFISSCRTAHTQHLCYFAVWALGSWWSGAHSSRLELLGRAGKSECSHYLLLQIMDQFQSLPYCRRQSCNYNLKTIPFQVGLTPLVSEKLKFLWSEEHLALFVFRGLINLRVKLQSKETAVNLSCHVSLQHHFALCSSALLLLLLFLSIFLRQSKVSVASLLLLRTCLETWLPLLIGVLRFLLANSASAIKLLVCLCEQ